MSSERTPAGVPARANYDPGMQFLLAIGLLFVPLGGPFVDASANASRTGDMLEVELQVEVNQTATVVIAHIVVGGDEPQRSVSLDFRGGDVFAGSVTLPVQESVVIFELLGPGGSVLSAATTLSEMGVDFGAFGARVTPLGEDPPVDPVTPAAKRWLWLAIAAGAAALSLLAFWAVGGKQEAQSPGDGSASDETAGESEDSG